MIFRFRYCSQCSMADRRCYHHISSPTCLAVLHRRNPESNCSTAYRDRSGIAAEISVGIFRHRFRKHRCKESARFIQSICLEDLILQCECTGRIPCPYGKFIPSLPNGRQAVLKHSCTGLSTSSIYSDLNRLSIRPFGRHQITLTG